MEKPMYPSRTIRITQKDNVGTHLDSFAFDEACENGGISNIFAPFTGIIKKVYNKDANEVWLESIDKVEYPDGTIDYLTMMFAHDNDISDLFVGKKIAQYEKFYSEGTKGNATGNHCHIECGKGKFTGTGWHKNKFGYYSINNGKKVTDCLWIDDSYTLANTQGYQFKKINKLLGNPTIRNENKWQVEVKIDNLNARSTPNGKKLGYIRKGIYDIIESKNSGKYKWFKLETSLWIAYDISWAVEYPKKDDEKIQRLIEKINLLEKDNKKLKDLVIKIKKETTPKTTFICDKTGEYQIKLKKGEILKVL